MITSALVFIGVLILLVMVHELGHFLAAKISKMRVEEFAFGFPPNVFKKKIGETVYAFNALPIGGYVKITGESMDEEEREKLKTDTKAFQNRPRVLQLFVLFAGVAMNLVLAFVLLFFINLNDRLMSADSDYFKNSDAAPSHKLYVSSILSESPAQAAGLKEGDQILNMISGKDRLDISMSSESFKADEVIDFVKRNGEFSITIVYKNKNNNISTSTISAVYGLHSDRKSVGMAVAYGSYVKLTPLEALRSSAGLTYEYTAATIGGLKDIVVKLFKGEDGIMDSLSGPVGIAKIIGSASSGGPENLLFIVAILSINLAVFNLLPVPALDGGRILFVLYEALTRRSINHKVQYYVNVAGFLLLIALMVLTTYFDIIKILD